MIATEGVRSFDTERPDKMQSTQSSTATNDEHPNRCYKNSLSKIVSSAWISLNRYLLQSDHAFEPFSTRSWRGCVTLVLNWAKEGRKEGRDFGQRTVITTAEEKMRDNIEDVPSYEHQCSKCAKEGELGERTMVATGGVWGCGAYGD